MNLATEGANHRTQIFARPPKRLLLIAVVSCAASGCASFQGEQSPSVGTSTAIKYYANYINQDVVTPFYASGNGSAPAAGTPPSPDGSRHGMTAEAWRNSVIDARIAVADSHYGDFVRSLTGERNTVTLSTEVVALGLSSGAAVAAQATANALAAAATGVTGVGTALSKELYQQATVQVLVTTMDANRAQVLARLITGEKKSAADYSIGQALGDLSDYEYAGSLHRALGTAASAANNAKAAADTAVKVATLSGNYSYDTTYSPSLEKKWLNVDGTVNASNAAAIQDCMTTNKIPGIPYSLVWNGSAAEKLTVINCLAKKGI